MSTASPSTFPLVSIIMPTWNRADLIGESIRSVIDQTYQHWELIVVDDGSIDNTREVVSGYSDERIHYYYQEHSGSIASIRAAAVKSSRGEFIAFHDSDDVWLHEKLAIQLDHLKKYPDAGYIITNGFHFGEQLENPANLESFFMGHLFLPMLMEERFIYFVPSLLFRKEAVGSVLLSSTTDLAFFLDLANLTQGIFTNERLVKIRKHTHSDSQMNPEKAFRDFLSMLDSFLAKRKITEAQHRQLKIRELYKLSLLHIEAHAWPNALHVLKQVNAIDPLHLKAWIRHGQVLWETKRIALRPSL